MSKLFEIVILNRYENLLCSPDNQFGYKRKHSTDLCIFSFKQVIDYYRNLSSPVFVCFLDASKAFDRVNHWYMLHKITVKSLPLFVVRLLMYWFTDQNFV